MGEILAAASAQQRLPLLSSGKQRQDSLVTYQEGFEVL